MSKFIETAGGSLVNTESIVRIDHTVHRCNQQPLVTHHAELVTGQVIDLHSTFEADELEQVIPNHSADLALLEYDVDHSNADGIYIEIFPILGWKDTAENRGVLVPLTFEDVSGETIILNTDSWHWVVPFDTSGNTAESLLDYIYRQAVELKKQRQLMDETRQQFNQRQLKAANLPDDAA